MSVLAKALNEEIRDDILGSYDNFKDLEYSLKEKYNEVRIFRYNSHTLKIELGRNTCYADYRRNRNAIEILECLLLT